MSETESSQAPLKDLKAIARRFLEGTTATAPHEAVSTGQRSLTQWCTALMGRYADKLDTNPNNPTLRGRPRQELGKVGTATTEK